MVMLGDLLAAARAGSGEFGQWLRASDPELAAAVEAAAAAEGSSMTSFVRGAISEFSRFASEEDWATLTSSIKNAQDPGTTCLVAMVDWRLSIHACPVHSHQHPSEGGEADERRHPRQA